MSAITSRAKPTPQMPKPMKSFSPKAGFKVEECRARVGSRVTKTQRPWRDQKIRIKISIRTLEGPEDEELGGVVLRLIEPHILPNLHHSLHKERAKPCSPNTYQT